ncbi:hypothetical protein FPV67DRAFT_1676141 [Lyophyllum atratum]|nr:hypothetical protein FPV67DRAFT_1676141 [Lyophyllum atratum]
MPGMRFCYVSVNDQGKQEKTFNAEEQKEHHDRQEMERRARAKAKLQAAKRARSAGKREKASHEELQKTHHEWQEKEWQAQKAEAVLPNATSPFQTLHTTAPNVPAGLPAFEHDSHDMSFQHTSDPPAMDLDMPVTEDHNEPQMSHRRILTEPPTRRLLYEPLERSTAVSPPLPSVGTELTSIDAPDEVGMDKIDYVTPVLGVELSDASPQVEWPSGAITVVPFIPHPENPNTNILTRDAQFVTNITLAMDARKSSFVRYLESTGSNEEKLIEVCRNELAHGNVVVVTDSGNFAGQLGGEFDESVFRNLGYRGKGRSFDIHDALRRIDHPEAPQLKGQQLDVLLKSVTDHSKVQCILDMPSRTSLIPPLIDLLNDGSTSFQEIQDIYPESIVQQNIHDNRSWLLAHTAGFLTYPHRDAGGLCTFIKGFKMWVVYRAGGYLAARNRKELDHQQKKFEDKEGGPGEPSGFGIEEDEQCEVAVIHAQPNSTVIMPPGVFHAVYTPIRNVAKGGHLFLYDALHLTEAARASDHKRAKFVTNTEHVSVGRTLARMAIALLRLSSDMIFYRKPIIALCLMVKYPKRYAPDKRTSTHTKQPEACQELKDSVVVVDALIKGLEIASYLRAGGPDYLFEGDVYWMNPGPVIDIAPALAGFDPQDPFHEPPISLPDPSSPPEDDVMENGEKRKPAKRRRKATP